MVVRASHRVRRICLEKRVGLSASNRCRDQACRTRVGLRLRRSLYLRSIYQKQSELVAVYGCTQVPDLPSPEERILESVHTS